MLPERPPRYDLDDHTWLEPVPAGEDPEPGYEISDVRGRRWRVRRRGSHGFGPSPAIALLVLSLLVVAVLAWASIT